MAFHEGTNVNPRLDPASRRGENLEQLAKSFDKSNLLKTFLFLFRNLLFYGRPHCTPKLFKIEFLLDSGIRAVEVFRFRLNITALLI